MAVECFSWYFQRDFEYHEGQNVLILDSIPCDAVYALVANRQQKILVSGHSTDPFFLPDPKLFSFFFFGPRAKKKKKTRLSS